MLSSVMKIFTLHLEDCIALVIIFCRKICTTAVLLLTS